MVLEPKAVGDIAGLKEDTMPLPNFKDVANLKTSPITHICIVIEVFQTILVTWPNKTDTFKNKIRNVEERPDKSGLKVRNNRFPPVRRPSEHLYRLPDLSLIIDTFGFLYALLFPKPMVTG